MNLWMIQTCLHTHTGTFSLPFDFSNSYFTVMKDILKIKEKFISKISAMFGPTEVDLK